ncbi:Holliday junction branch migration protein RuvA [Candidatus Sulfidibacterium hydrothermale]|uniref:Holliday junction branch migration protein RuvA n=1 Tax=Candidatus Sulfidibacterium hydrothermale TaxID=2875962 RepID=UPI001F0A447B|nr:Holliday junction branch migration protein RuvA [Candidatus Sulfidibacterium hydrothermale]UBM62943.1 Holliday junction branch migration protein RuvA [Candidatus Sulfidibacterium hydrothermale]
MYEYFSGRVVEKSPTHVVIDNQGIGYRINISLYTFDQIKDRESVKLFVHYVVREDAQILYGFADEQERELFRALISVSGVGANTARLVLSSLSADEAYNAIASGDAAVLQSVKGIGAKTAQRIVVDLKDKLVKQGFLPDKVSVSNNTIKNEALSGLVILGFNKVMASKVLDKLLKKSTFNSVEALIKEALKNM